jgi:hypothetical protein
LRTINSVQYDTTDLEITIVYNPTVPAYGLELSNKNKESPVRIKKIVFSGTERAYEYRCQYTQQRSKCRSEYCYLPTYHSISRLPMYPIQGDRLLDPNRLSKPICIVYYDVGMKTKMAATDSISITDCKIEAIPGIFNGYHCYWLNGCND